MEIVLLLGFADAIFRRERSDDRKCVWGSQANGQRNCETSVLKWDVSDLIKNIAGSSKIEKA